MLISIDTEKVLGRIQHPFTIKTFKNLRIEENFLNLINGITDKYEKPTNNDEE